MVPQQIFLALWTEKFLTETRDTPPPIMRGIFRY